QDAFVTKLSSSGNALVYSTYLGGSSRDVATGIAVDTAGRAHITGYTASTDFPMASALQSTNAGAYDAFIARLTAAGNMLDLGTYLGGSGSDSSYAIALDSVGNIYAAGQTVSIDFPTAAATQVYQLSAMSAWVAEIGTPADLTLSNLTITTGSSAYQAANS